MSTAMHRLCTDALVHMQCISNCVDFGPVHGSPMRNPMPSNNTLTEYPPSETCPRCVGRDRRAKKRYRTEHEAKEIAQFLRSERGVNLRVYECPHGSGWHLTKG